MLPPGCGTQIRIRKEQYERDKKNLVHLHDLLGTEVHGRIVKVRSKVRGDREEGRKIKF